MKLLLTCCFLGFFAVMTYGQDCKTLDSLTSFHGIKFGKRFPDSLRKYCEKEYNEVRADSGFYIWHDKIKPGSKFADWLNVRLSFSDMVFQTIKDGRVYMVLLIRDFEKSDSISLSNKEYPYFFEEVTKEIISVFGEMTKEEVKQEQFDNAISRTWECKKMKIEFRLNLLFKTYALSFMNKELDKERKLLKYKN